MIDLAAVDIKQQICNVDVLYTFEGPRTGNYEYA
jgi:hypothetical protein